MTQRYSVSGTLTPDATTADTGVAAGTVEGKPYWTWINDVGTWYLHWVPLFSGWLIANALFPAMTKAWVRPNEDPVGEYIPLGILEQEPVTGNPVVAEYVEPPPVAETYITLQIHSGPNAGKYIVLKES